MTVAQALVRFLAAQEHRARRRAPAASSPAASGSSATATWPGSARRCSSTPDLLPYHQARNEQAMVHIAAGYARQRNRLGASRARRRSGRARPTWSPARRWRRSTGCRCCCCRATRSPRARPHPVLQQLEAPHDATLSVNDCFKPVSRYFDRIERPEQLVPAALEAMRVLTDPAETGAVTLALPEDVQTEAFDVPDGVPRAARLDGVPPAAGARRARAGGRADPRGAAAADRRRRRRDLRRGDRRAAPRSPTRTGIPVGETQAGRGALPSDHPLALGAIGATGTPAANRLAARGRPRDRHRHALERLHDRVQVGVPGPGRAVRERQRRGLRRGQAQRRCALVGRRAARARGAAATRSPATASTPAWEQRARRRGGRVGPRGRAARHRRPRAAAEPGRGDRRGQRRRRAGRRRRVRGGLDAGRPAQALARARPEGLPRRVRLLVHGLRDPRRDRRQARRARARGLRDGRRRLVPDAAGRARDRGRRGHQDRRRARRRTTATRRSARSRARSARRLRHALPAARLPLDARAGRSARRSTSPPTPRASARG